MVRDHDDDSANCGACRRSSADGTAALDQGECVDALMPMRHVNLVKVKADEPAGGQLPDLFVSLLGTAVSSALAAPRCRARRRSAGGPGPSWSFVT
eukprot:1089202-Pyramimonas_sp.AAC.1